MKMKASMLPAVAGCFMICASFLPWLSDPLGENYSAWRLSIDIGWQFRVSILNYGLLCFCCAIYTFLIACAYWKPFRNSDYFLHRHVTAGLLCLVPVALFLLQYLCTDPAGIDLLAQHKIQALLIRQHFGYSVATEPIRFSAFQLDTSTLEGRLELFVDQVSIGFLLPCLSFWICIYSQRFVPRVRSVASKKPRARIWPVSIGILLLVILLGRIPAAMICEYEAKGSLAAGNYLSALGWLNGALVLNPALNQFASYHIERGQALYFLRLDQQSDDSRAYLAFSYREQGDYLDGYQQLLGVWQAHRTTPWVVEEMSITLERLAEYIQPLNGPPVRRPDNDARALPWLQLLQQVDAHNVYSHYAVGRIQYDLHNYTVSMNQMSMVIHSSTDADIQSSAYTFMALSDAGEGNYVGERTLLLKAIELDPNYHNNTAREYLSGLR